MISQREIERERERERERRRQRERESEREKERERESGYLDVGACVLFVGAFCVCECFLCVRWCDIARLSVVAR